MSFTCRLKANSPLTRFLCTGAGGAGRPEAAVGALSSAGCVTEWKQIACPNCGGHGIVSHYSYGPGGVDFEGADECKQCSGSGELWLSPKGMLALYPGGPFVGRVTSAYFAHYNSAGEA